MSVMSDGAREALTLFHFDQNYRFCGRTVVAGERASSVEVGLGEIVREAVRFASGAVVIVHNHPGGTPKPSRADIATTRLIAQALRALNVRVHDHLVVTSQTTFSFRAAGLL